MKYNHIDLTAFPSSISPSAPVSPFEFMFNNIISVISCVFIILILLKVIDMEMSYRKRVRQEKKRAAIAPPAFAFPEHAQAVFLHANVDYYQYLLEELRCGLREEGYEITDDRKRRIRLPGDIERRVAKRVFLARERFTCPYLSASQLDEKGKESLSNGNTVQWLHWLIAGNESQGWFITSRDEPDQ